LHNILKRARKENQESTTLGCLNIHFNELTIKDGKHSFNLTPRESELLRYLIENQNTILKREQILEELWGQNDYFLGRSMDVFISRLRKYLQAEQSISLETKRGVGFIFKVKSRTSE
jgi:DNA-binding response OmpR family regulator